MNVFGKYCSLKMFYLKANLFISIGVEGIIRHFGKHGHLFLIDTHICTQSMKLQTAAGKLSVA